ncbi:MAG: hypothetical protein WDN31_02640 [Hyphomicrobium sp.]
MRALVIESPGGSAPPLEAVVEHAPRLRVNAAKLDMDVRMLFIIMRDEKRLMLGPSHVLEEGFRRLDHVLARWRLVGVPVQGDMLHRPIGGSTAPMDAGLLLEKLGLVVGRVHLVDD